MQNENNNQNKALDNAGESKNEDQLFNAIILLKKNERKLFELGKKDNNQPLASLITAFIHFPRNLD